MRRANGSDALARRVYAAPSRIHGQGCFARVPFMTGDRIGTFEGTSVSEDGTHVLWVFDADSGEMVGRRGENLLRWLNHSDEPNAEFDGFELYARRAIVVDEEITIDYQAGS